MIITDKSKYSIIILSELNVINSNNGYHSLKVSDKDYFLFFEFLNKK